MIGSPRLRIRRAESSDAESLALLWTETGEHLIGLNHRAFKMPEPSGLVEWFTDNIAETAGDGDSATFVAEGDGQVVGTVYVRIIPPEASAPQQLLRELGLTRAEVDALAVSAAFRRRGIGKRLMQEAERWARMKGAVAFELDTYLDSPLSVPFYESLGYARRSVRFVKPPELGAPQRRK